MRSRKVQTVDDERDIGNGIIVTLKYGWSFENKVHEGVRGFETFAEAKESVKGQTYRCLCAECVAAG